MNKLITYFKQGKGRGLRAMLCFSLLISVLLWAVTYYPVKNIPNNKSLNQFIDQLPTIVLENGTIVEPVDVNASYTFNGQPIFYIQTDRDDVSPLSADGIYLTRTKVTFFAEGQVQKTSFLTGSATITHDTIISIIRSLVIWIPIVLALSYFIFLWLFYLVVVAISTLITLICRFKLNKGTIWRAASFSTITILLIDIIMSTFGISIGKRTYPIIIQLLTSILLVLLIIYGVREKKEVKKETKKQEKKN